MKLNEKINNIFIIFGFIFLPVALFLSPENLAQYDFKDVFLIIFFHTILITSFCLLSIICYSFFKRKLNFLNFIILNVIFFYLLFFYKDFLIYLNIFENIFRLLDNFLVILLFLIIIGIVSYFIIKENDKLKKFLVFYIFLNFLFIFFNHSIFFYKITNFDSSGKINFKNNKINYDKYNPNQANGDIFFVVLDGMMNLELAEKYNIIENKDDYIKQLSRSSFYYNNDFFSNYNVTYLSIASLLEGNYPVNETSPRYKSRKPFFPIMLKNDAIDQDFFEILKSSKRDFFWLGNSVLECSVNKFVNCINFNQTINFVNKIKHLYNESIFIYPINYYIKKNTESSVDSLKFLRSKEYYLDSKKTSSRSIYLIHVMSPHIPHIFDSKCHIFNEPKYFAFNGDSKEDLEFYANSYKCLLKIFLNWSKQITDINKNNSIYVLSDHGWFFENKRINEENNLNKINTRFMSFYAHKVPKSCKNIDPPNSTVNILRHALNCLDSQKINYLPDKKFDTKYEDDADYGIVKEYKN